MNVFVHPSFPHKDHRPVGPAERLPVTSEQICIGACNPARMKSASWTGSLLRSARRVFPTPSLSLLIHLRFIVSCLPLGIAVKTLVSSSHGHCTGFEDCSLPPKLRVLQFSFPSLSRPRSLSLQSRTAAQLWTPRCPHLLLPQFTDVFPLLGVPRPDKPHCCCPVSAEQRGIIASLSRLAMLLFIHTRAQRGFAAAWAAAEHHQVGYPVQPQDLPYRAASLQPG